MLDNLQLQHISDEVGYLTSVGRVRAAQVRKNARIGEVRAKASAAVQRAQSGMAAELSKIDADIQLARKENERRIADWLAEPARQVRVEERLRPEGLHRRQGSGYPEHAAGPPGAVGRSEIANDLQALFLEFLGVDEPGVPKAEKLVHARGRAGEPRALHQGERRRQCCGPD